MPRWVHEQAPVRHGRTEVGDEVVAGFLAGFGAHIAVHSVVAVDVSVPTLNDFRLRESRRILDAVSRRTGRRPD